MNDIEYRAPRGTIKTSRNGWQFVSSTEDADRIYDSIAEYLDKMGNLSDEELSSLFNTTVTSNIRDIRDEDTLDNYKADASFDLASKKRGVVKKDFSRKGRKQKEVISDIFTPLEDTLEILNQSFNFFVKNGKFTEEDKEINKKNTEDVLAEVETLRKNLKDKFSKIFDKAALISDRRTEDEKNWQEYKKEEEYRRQVENGILSWYRAMKKGEEEEKPSWWPYSRKKNPDYYKMIIDEKTGEGTVYKLKDESDMDDNGRGYREFCAVCSDEIEKEVGKIPNADRKKAEEFIMSLDKKYDTIERTEPGWRFKTGFEDTGD
jgi:hypothetical protein